MSEIEGWCQWREGDNLHEQRPAPHNIGGYARATHFGHFSKSNEALRAHIRTKLGEAFERSLFRELFGP